MLHHRRSTSAARPAWAAVALLATVWLAGCAEVHHGVEAVGRVGSSPVEPAPIPDAPVRMPGPGIASAVPSPRDIFDFHPAGAPRDAWRQPFVIDNSDGPLAADVRRSSAELKAFLADKDRAARAKPRGCSETDVAVNKPGCGAAASKIAPAP